MNDKQVNIANRIFNTALNNGINERVSGYIVNQSAHETNGWQSSLFKRANNGFGMNVPSKRKTSFIKGKDLNSNYATYNNIEDSTKDLISWFNYNKVVLNNINSLEQYATILKSKSYYEDTFNNYLAGLKTFSLRLAGLLKKHSGLVSIIYLFVSIAIILLIIKK